MNKGFSKEQIATEIVTQIKEMGMSDVFNEEFINKVQESVSNTFNSENVLEEEVDVDESENKEIETDLTINDSGITEKPSEEEYTPQLPNFINKIEPAEIVIFDNNELSEGGVNLSNKLFRTFNNVDEKKSLHQYWIEEGKRKAKVYIAKFEEIGDIDFDPMAGTSSFKEKIVEIPNIPGEKTNPYADSSNNMMVVGQNSAGPVSLDPSKIDIQAALKNYIEDALRTQLNSNNTIEAPKVNTPVDNTEDNVIYSTNMNDESEEENEESKEVESELVSEVSEDFDSNDIKMVDVAMNDSLYQKIDAPKGLRESIKNEDELKNLLVSKGEEVQEIKYEGDTYLYPTNIISSNKCYIKL